MTTASGTQLSVGLRFAAAFPINSTGYPDATSTAVYEGLEFGGPKAFELSVPDVRRISHTGNDRVLALDFLPPTEGMSGQLRIARHENSINATLMGVTNFTVGETKNIAWGTDAQGSEPDVALFLFQQSLDSLTKLRRWRYIIVPKARVIPMLSGMSENSGEVVYSIAPSPSTKHVWGTALATGTEGVTEAAVIEGMSEDRPKLVAWKTDGVEVAFLFPTSKPASDVAKVTCWLDGVLVSSGITVTTTAITYAVAPTTGKYLVALYEF